jgi:DNA excision repair protein ERCC-5
VLRRGTSSLEIDCAEKMFCEQYVAKDLENELGLSRERLALLALLLGSDYTEGISGIGIVNAMETLAAFPTIDDLVSFKDWLDSPDIDQFRAVTQAARRKEGDGMYELPPASHLHDSLAADVGANASAGNHLHPQHHCCTVAWSSSHIESPHRVTWGRQSAAVENDPHEGAEEWTGSAVDKYKLAHRTVCKAWDVPNNFPEERVLHAYANPVVDTSKTPFTFHKPDIAILRGYCQKTFDWSSVRPSQCHVRVHLDDLYRVRPM